MPYWFAGREVPNCYWCENEPTIYAHVTISDEPCVIFICPDHGGPRYPLPIPDNAAAITETIKLEVDDYLHNLVDQYEKTGFSYGGTRDGFLEWAYAERFLTTIPASSKPRRRTWRERFAAVREP